MAHTAWFVCLNSGGSKKAKIALERGRAGNGHKTKLEQSPFLRYATIDIKKDRLINGTYCLLCMSH